MQCSNFDTVCKVIVVGNGQVGKTTLLTMFCQGRYTSEYKKTIGTDFMQKKLHIDGEDVSLDLYDTAGQEVFADLCSWYYRGAGACAIAFSTTDRASFDAVTQWKEKVEKQVDPPPTMCLVQTKIDMLDKAQVSPEEADALAQKLGLKFFRISSKENFNVDEVFTYLASTWLATGRDAGDGAAEIVNPSNKPSKKEGFADTTTPSAHQPVSIRPTKGKTRATKKKRTCVVL